MSQQLVIYKEESSITKIDVKVILSCFEVLFGTSTVELVEVNKVNVKAILKDNILASDEYEICKIVNNYIGNNVFSSFLEDSDAQ